MKTEKFYNKKGTRLMNMGFTLVELLVAISILALSILATFTAVSNNIRGQNFSEDQVTAYYLADEGIESIRNIRDHNGILNVAALGSGGASIPWLTGIDPACVSSSCVVDSPLATVAPCPGNVCPYLNVNSATGLYGYSSGAGWVTTQFKRAINVSITSPTEAVVTCTISWVTNSVSKDYTVSEILRAWQ